MCIQQIAKAANQFFAFTPSGTLQVSGLCMEAVPVNTYPGYAPKAQTCDGSDRQRWEVTQDGKFRNRVTDRCLYADDAGEVEAAPPVRLLFCPGTGTRLQWDFGA